MVSVGDSNLWKGARFPTTYRLLWGVHSPAWHSRLPSACGSPSKNSKQAIGIRPSPVPRRRGFQRFGASVRPCWPYWSAGHRPRRRRYDVPEPLGPLPRAVAPRGLRDARDRARSGTLAGRRPYLPLSRRSGPARGARIHRLAHSRPQSGISLIPPHPSDGHRIISHIALDSELWGVARVGVWRHRIVKDGHGCPRISRGSGQGCLRSGAVFLSRTLTPCSPLRSPGTSGSKPRGRYCTSRSLTSSFGD